MNHILPTKLIPDSVDSRILTTKDVINATHVVVRFGRFPTRVVLRRRPDDPSEYVVHTETLEVDRRPENETKSVSLVHRSFENGDYFRDEAKARARFEERAAKL